MGIKIAQIKFIPEKGHLDSNYIELMRVMSDIIKDNNIDIIVMPECFLDGYIASEPYITKEDMVKYAIEPDTSQYVNYISVWAKNNNCWIIFGCSRKGIDGIYNSALVFNRMGQITGIFDKCHLQDHDLKFAPGNNLGVFDSDFGKFGIMICADRRWPETVVNAGVKVRRVAV
jgi:predicted amidohydrolase